MENKNVLIIYVDQLDRQCLSCYGSTDIETPSIDALAADGIVLDNFYTPSAVCTPSRGCFMTGNYPFVNGAFRNGVEISSEQVGFAEQFKKAGYRTGYVGKWHLGKYLDERGDLQDCNHLGFEEWEHKIEFGHCKSVHENDGKLEISKEIGDEKSYTTDWLADKTVAFISKQTAKQPFLFMVSIPDPHQPFKVRAPYDTMFDPNKLAVPKSFGEKVLPDWAAEDEWGRNHYFPLGLFEREAHFRRLKAQYLGEIKCIDDNVGKIIAALKANKLYDDTLIVFTTDHGDYMGEHGLLEKNNLYDSVYHLPLVTCCTSLLEKGQRRDCFVDTVDIPKTLCTLAGIDASIDCNGIDRSSVVMADRQCGDEEIYIHPSDVPRAGIITRQYELAYVGKGWNTDRVFKNHILFDRLRDPHQLNNLFCDKDMKGIIAELTEKIRKHHRRLKTPLEYLPQEVWYE